ncbi:MAG: hypothetical protein KGL00_04855 [Gammaproteobacteria bacterium]|nr:hypothetical protein [Gammaproteobacteria bacterium]MDE1886834.1 hypothetical protein [Gammaproteobacteria bacterium]MDE2024334.1 hypothetical protein [Gammaproteobacteria bacterium]MDE2138923.1 hypothetical protein [Gammaproteobacteria bacterium]MDE2273507.1 hypothetical protein [Gammaproteobacteria bacterium]
MHQRPVLLGITAAWLCLAPVAALAANESGWFASLGAFDPKASTNIRLDAPQGPSGTNLHLETDLNLPQRRVVPQVALGYRFDRRSSLEFNFFDLRRSGSRVIDENITYGGVNYALNTTVSTFSDVRTDSLQYRYAIVADYPWSLSVTAGVHATHFTIGLSDLNNGVSESADAQTPLPVVGLRGLYDLHGWQFRLEAAYFKMTVNGIRGHLNRYTLSAAHPLTDGLSLELGYTSYVLALRAERSDLTGMMRFAYQGPFLNLCYGCQTPLVDSDTP